jgi:hypothetical protein
MEQKGHEELITWERLRYQWMLDSVSKFRLFFAGLVFAMLSFSIQFAIVNSNRGAKWYQLAAWLLLLLTGMLALSEAGGFVVKHTEDVFEGLRPCAARTDVGVLRPRNDSANDRPCSLRLGNITSTRIATARTLRQTFLVLA